MAKKKEVKKVEMTRAQKTEATKSIIKELLAIKPMKHNELIEETAKLYTERYKSEETENINDVKGRAGSVLDIMKKESEVMYDGGMYALKARMPIPTSVKQAKEKPAKKAEKSTAKKEAVQAEEAQDKSTDEEKPAPKKRGRKAKETQESPAVTEEVKAEEKPAPKKRGRKPKATSEEPAPEGKDTPKTEEAKPEQKAQSLPETKAEKKAEEAKAEPSPVKEEPAKEEPKQEPKQEQTSLTVKPKAEVTQKGVVMDMSFLIGGVKDKAPKAETKPQKTETPKTPVQEEKKDTMSALNAEKPPQKDEKKDERKEVKTQEKPTQKQAPKVPQKLEQKPVVKQPQKQENKTKQKQPTADEKLRDAFLKRMRSLGGDYFEYYSVYLLERYCMKNGRRLEGMRISGGDRDGGIDGEIELTDKFGFTETIYIQSKNWDPDKGKEEYWTVGETLLQQFIGACACKQAKQGKQHCRGIFVTTSRFTPEAKRILDDMSDKIVGYDGNDLYETAKECAFGLVQNNGEWTLDEKLLSGTKAFFNML